MDEIALRKGQGEYIVVLVDLDKNGRIQGLGEYLCMRQERAKRWQKGKRTGIISLSNNNKLLLIMISSLEGV
jgi:hypothetical protein